MEALIDNPKPPTDVWTFTFRPLPSEIPVAVRVRQMLKVALRSYGLRASWPEPADVRAAGTADAPAGQETALPGLVGEGAKGPLTAPTPNAGSSGPEIKYELNSVCNYPART